MNRIKIIIVKVKCRFAAVMSRSPRQTTFIYCECGNELCSSDSFVRQFDDEHGDNHTEYKCSKCGKHSDFNFGIAPVPISWEELANVS